MSEEKCHHFIEGELRGLYDRELEDYLVGKVATCAACCSQTVRVSRWRSAEYPDRELNQVACGSGCGCTHNIAGYSLEDALNAWNDECDKEGDGPDYALKVVAKSV